MDALTLKDMLGIIHKTAFKAGCTLAQVVGVTTEAMYCCRASHDWRCCKSRLGGKEKHRSPMPGAA